MLLRAQARDAVALTQRHFNAVRHKSVGRITAHDVRVDLFVAGAGERLEDHHGGDEILLLPNFDRQSAVASAEVMERDGGAGLVRPHAPQHAPVFRVCGAALGEGGPDDCHDIISSL